MKTILDLLYSKTYRQQLKVNKLEVGSAQAIENLQFFALRHNYDIEIGTSDKPQRIFKITPTTHYVRRANILVDIEYYYYGTSLYYLLWST